MDRIAVGRALVALAKELVAIEFPTQDALDKYLKEHPDADTSNHTVKETKKETKKDKQRREQEESRKRREEDNKRVPISGFKDLKPSTLTKQEQSEAESVNYDKAMERLKSGRVSNVNEVLQEAKGREKEIKTTVEQWVGFGGEIPSGLKDQFERELALMPHQIKGVEKALEEWEKQGERKSSVVEELVRLAKSLTATLYGEEQPLGLGFSLWKHPVGGWRHIPR